MQQDREGTAGRSVTARALQVLEAFTAEHPSLTLTEMARRAGVPLSTAHRLAGDLLAWGALERDGHGHFTIGLRLWELGSLAPRGQVVREAALPFMEDLHEVTGQQVQLAVLEEHEVRYLEHLCSPSLVPVHGRVGERLPAHATAVGRVLLAYASPDVRDSVLGRPLVALTECTVTDPAQLRALLADVARDGAAITCGQVAPDGCSVAAPVVAPAGGVIAALAVVVPADGPPPQVLVPAVQAAARGVSRALRRAEPPPL